MTGPAARRTALLLLYVAVLGVFFEGSARVFFRVLCSYKGGVPGDHADAAWRLRWIERHRAQTEITFPFDVYDSDRGWALKPSLTNVPVFDQKRLSTNAKGIRGGVEYAYQKPPGTKRIGVFGDSFTFGEEVSDDETFADRLGRLMPAAEVLNFGVHGYGHDQMLVYLQREGVKYGLDLVVLGFVYPDVERNVLAFRDFAKPMFGLERGALVLLNTPVPTIDEVVRWEPYRLRFADLVTILYQEGAWRSGSREQAARRLTTAIVKEMQRTVESNGGRMLAAYLPVVDEINHADPDPTDGERYFFAACAEQGLPCMSTRTAILAEHAGKPPLVPGKHWPAAEHLATAVAIRDYVVEKQLLERN